MTQSPQLADAKKPASSQVAEISVSLNSGRRVTDWGQLVSADIAGVAEPKTEAELQGIVHYAVRHNLKISLRGIGHSAGGQSFRSGGIMIDIRRLNRILDLDTQNRRVRIQSGANWEVLTRALEPHGLAVTTKQEFDTFTIGGSVAANVHGKTIDYGPLIESIREFRLLNSQGDIIRVSRTENAELFRLAIGGYGLFGIVVDVTFDLVEDLPVEKTELVFMNPKALCTSYLDRVRRPDKPPLCYGFLNAECTESFYVTYTYETSGRKYALEDLKRDEPNPHLFNLLAFLLRRSRFLRKKSFRLMWIESARQEVTLRSRRLLLWDHAPKAFKGMLLQKFYLPCDRFLPFAQKAGRILSRYNLAILTNHFRFVPGGSEAFMNFGTEDTICLIPAYLAEKQNPSWIKRFEKATHELLDACLDEGGRYYLTFDAIASKEQFHRAYPQAREFFALKRKYDPQEVFSSQFYDKYRD